MKTIELSQFAANVNELMQSPLNETLIVTRAGKAFAFVQGLEYDEEQLQLMNSREFWAMIQERRQQPAIPLNEALKEIDSAEE